MQPRQPRSPTTAKLLGAVIFVGFNLLMAGWFLDITALLVIGLIMAVVSAMVAYVLSKGQGT